MEFNWNGKEYLDKISLTPSMGTLRPCKDDSKDWDTTENLYIEGDNLEVLKLLQKSYFEKVKMIYIDPPYNTGKDFVYKDNFNDNLKNYLEVTGQLGEEGERLSTNSDQSGRYHSNWLNMMYPRLKLARNLLKDDGVVFISIDDNEVTNLKKMCDEIFGEDNFIGEITWESTTQPINSGRARFNLQQKVEPILFYSKNKNFINGFILREINSNLKYPHDGKSGKCRFEIIEKSDAGAYNRETMKFEILGQIPRKGKRWQIGKDTAIELEKNNRLEIVNGIVKKAVYPEDEIDKKKFEPFWSHFTAGEVGTAQNGKDELNKIMEVALGFDTVKPVKLLENLLFHFDKNSIILDFFSGSATTAHAVMKLNLEDNGNRKFIMVQLPETTDEKSDAYKAGYRNICEIGKERIRRAGEQIKKEFLETNENLKLGEEPKEFTTDIGFKVFKLDK